MIKIFFQKKQLIYKLTRRFWSNIIKKLIVDVNKWAHVDFQSDYTVKTDQLP